MLATQPFTDLVVYETYPPTATPEAQRLQYRQMCVDIHKLVIQSFTLNSHILPTRSDLDATTVAYIDSLAYQLGHLGPDKQTKLAFMRYITTCIGGDSIVITQTDLRALVYLFTQSPDAHRGYL